MVADVQARQNASNSSGGDLLDHLIRPRQQSRRNREAERLGGLEVDDKLELRRLFDAEVGRFHALEDSRNVARGGASVYHLG